MGKKKDYIFLCTGSDCRGKGSDTLKKQLKQLRKTDPRFVGLEIIKTHCMDSCKKGPNLIYKGKMWHNPEIPADLES